MNLDKVKNVLSKIKDHDKASKDKEEQEKLFWKPKYGRHIIRVVPSKYFPDLPAHDVLFYYDVAKHPMMSLVNLGKQDPIQEFIEKLRETDDRDNWSLSYKIGAKSRFFVPVIVRGEEAEGVRLWGVAASINKKLLSFASDEEIGDFTDPVSGFDIKVEYEEGKKGSYATTAIDVARKSTPLSNDADQIDSWLSDQPNPVEDQIENSYDYMKKQLEIYIQGGEEETEEEEAPKEEKKDSFELKTTEPSEKKQEKAKAKEPESFDDLFN